MTLDKRKKLNAKRKELFLVSLLGVALCVAVWLVTADGETLLSSSKQYSETESK